MREWSIDELARRVGVTSRTLRHYDHIGLLPPSRVGSNGYRYYDEQALLRLQRILLLRQLGLRLPAIAEVLAAQQADVPRALAQHRAWLEAERDRIDQQITTLTRTLQHLEQGRPLMPEDVFQGFDPSHHRDEVEQRWGKEAYARGDRWWRGLGADGQATFLAEATALAAAWGQACRDGATADGAIAQALAARHAGWLAGIPGTPGHDEGAPPPEYLRGLADTYVADPRFAAGYDAHHPGTAELVAAALRVYADRDPSA